MILRFLIPVVLVGGILGWLVWYLIRESNRQARVKRRQQYSTWLETVADMSPAEHIAATAHMLRIAREEPKSEYRGPWENVS